MSNTDSFIEEVTEEVRRDRLFGYLRRYGWIAALAIVLLVGGTAWNEWRKAQSASLAQARGDAISAALSIASPEGRASALVELAPTGVVEAFLAASEQQASGDIDGASETLAELASRPDIAPLYRDLAQIKRLSADSAMQAEERALILEALSAPGAPYRTIAQELRALDTIAAGDADEALSALQAILQDAEASGPQRARVSQLVIALGGTPELASPLVGDTSVAPAE